MGDHSWLGFAKCSPALPFINREVSREQQRKMANVCASCPVMANCLSLANRQQHLEGFWAGRSRGQQVVEVGRR